jgi:hypothetical protein
MLALPLGRFPCTKQIDKPDSVPPIGRDYHFSCPLVTQRILAVLPLLLELQEEKGATLHRGKDLAVSLPPFDRIIPPGNPRPFGSGVTARTSLIAQDGRYPLPATCCHVDVRTFLTAPLYRGERDSLICFVKEHRTWYIEA